MINVTKPFLPPVEEYQAYVNDIWKRSWLTNNGPLVNELELKLKEYLGIPHLLFMTNGTITLQMSLRALDIHGGEVITTPFSFVATTSTVVWENSTPVFVDIHPETLNIDPAKIEAAITPNTKAILATHVYGNPCDIDAIEAIAQKHNLKVIYDAAHCFGTKYKGKSVLEYGDISSISFHATKLFHTIEGGAVAAKDPELIKKMSRLRNFGHSGPESFDGVGINGKNSEFHAAMGLVNLRYINEIMKSRREQSEYYDKQLKTLKVWKPKIQEGTEYNYSYYPVVFESESALLKAMTMLNDNWVYPRRYFYPSLGELDYVDKYELPIANDISRRVLCLPLYHSLSFEEIDFVCRILLRAQNN